MSFLRAHLNTMRDTLRILQGQLETLDAAVVSTEVPTAKPSLPDRCDGIARCGLQDDDARQRKATFANPRAWKCVSCGHEEGLTGVN